MTARVLVLASGSGTLLQSLLDAQCPDFQVVALVTDQPSAPALERAARAGVASAAIPLADFPNRAEWNQALADTVLAHRPDLVVSAGFMRVIAEPLLSALPGRLINTHPALLPAFPGAHAVRDALAAGAATTGSTVHFVDAGVDTGPIIRQESVTVMPDDDEATLHERIKQVERDLLVEVVTDLAKGRYRLEGREVVRDDN